MKPHTTKLYRPLICLCLILKFYSSEAQSKVTMITGVDGSQITSSALDVKIDSLLNATNMAGLSIAIINNSKMVYHQTFGYANSQTKTSVDDETIFEGASLSKPIFAYFVLKMVEKGLLDLDKPLYEYLPHPGIAENSLEDYKLITARMVLSHQTGFPNHSNGKAIELAFKPGTDFMYSGEAFQYLAAIISMLNGVDFKDGLNTLFQKEVTQPLGMDHTTFIWDDYLEKHKAFGHNNEGMPTQNNPSFGGWSGKTFNAFSSLHSESKEYALFLIALLQKEGLKSDTFSNMFKEHIHFKDTNKLKEETVQTGWGLGMAQKSTKYGLMNLHTGNNHDFQSYMMILPEKEFGIVFFTNSNKAIPFIEGLNDIVGPIF